MCVCLPAESVEYLGRKRAVDHAFTGFRTSSKQISVQAQVSASEGWLL